MCVLHLTASVRRSLCDIYLLPEASCQHLIVRVRAREDVPSWHVHHPRANNQSILMTSCLVCAAWRRFTSAYRFTENEEGWLNQQEEEMFVHPLLRQIRPVISILETFGRENSPQVSLIFARPAWIFATLLSMVDTKNTRLKKLRSIFIRWKKNTLILNTKTDQPHSQKDSAHLSHTDTVRHSIWH